MGTPVLQVAPLLVLPLWRKLLLRPEAISVELPISIVREVEYTEPAVKGDTSGKVVKPARLAGTGYELSVPDFVNIGDKIEIDTRTNEFRKRV